MSSDRHKPLFLWSLILIFVTDSSFRMIAVNEKGAGATIPFRLLLLFGIIIFGAITGWTIWHLRVKFFRNKYEARLNRLIERYNMASSTAKLAVWDYDLVNDSLIWDDMVYELYGVTKEKFPPVYSSWLNLLHPDDSERADNDIRKAIREGNDYSTEFRVITPVDQSGILRHSDI